MIETWIIPCNIKFFNVIDHFKTSKTIVWQNAFSIHEGDIVYIYIGRPYSEIRYKCRVINDCVSEELLQANSYAISKIKSNNYYSKKEKYMQLECVCEYPEGFLTLEKLRDHGLGQVQIQARADRKVRAFLTDTDTLHAAGGVL